MLPPARFFIELGVDPANIVMIDSRGVIHDGRDDLSDIKREFAVETGARTLDDAMVGADAFVGVSVAGTVTKEMVRSMADRPIVFALANPDPEISYPDAKAARDDVVMATGRSDYPNQVNNVLGFPFIFGSPRRAGKGCFGGNENRRGQGSGRPRTGTRPGLGPGRL